MTLALRVGGVTWRCDLAECVGGVRWRRALAEWASRAGKIDGFRSEDRETRQQLPRPLAVGGLRLAPFDWRTRLADLSGGATWRSGLA